jgi:hypothetical protein
VSTNLRVWFSGVVLVGGLAFVGSSWEGFDGRSPQSTEPRLLTEDYQVEMLTVPGTEDRFVFGMLPDLAARAEVHPLSGKAQVQVRTYGGGGRYVAEPVPAGRECSDMRW